MAWQIDRHQAIIWTNAEILLIKPWGTNFSDMYSYISVQENTYENVVCGEAAILSRPQCVNRWRRSYAAGISVNANAIELIKLLLWKKQWRN